MRAETGSGLRAAVAVHLKDPLRRASYALILGTGITSALGMVFWVVTARWFPTEAVGVAAALTSAMSFLANVSTLGLRNGLVRFLALAGASTARFVTTCYALCMAAAALAAVIFIVGQPWWAAELGLLRESPWAGGFFVAATAVWVVFVLQDHVLTGLRQAVWVPAANGAYAVTKIGLLPLMAFAASWAIFAAYVLPAAAVAVLVTALVFRRLVTGMAATGQAPRFPLRDLVRFAAGDHLSAILWLATAELMTLVVLDAAGAEASAYYFMAFTIAYSFYMLTSNIGSAFVAEAAQYPERALHLARQAFLNTARLVLPLVGVAVVGAPLILRLLGPDYADHGTTLLRLLLLSAVPQVVIGTSLALARVQRRIRTIIAIYAAVAAGVFGLTLATIGRWGLLGVGLAWLVTQTVLALVLLPTQLRPLWHGLAWWAGAAGLAGRARAGLQQRLQGRRARRELPGALAACGVAVTGARPRLLTSSNDALVVAADVSGAPAVVKIALSAAASAGLDHHSEMLTWLPQQLPGTSREWLPRLLHRGRLHGHTVLVESRLSGQVATRAGAGSAVRLRAALSAAARAAAELHTSTATGCEVGAALLADWVHEPVAALRRQNAPAALAGALDALAERLHRALEGRRVTASCTHGDLWLGNVLLDRPSAATGVKDLPRVTGLIDWENARRCGLPDVDLVHLWLTAQPVELGAAVLNALREPAPTLRACWAELSAPLPNPDLEPHDLVLLAWLWHVTAELGRSTLHRPSRVWVACNVTPVLARLGMGTPVSAAPSGRG